MGSDGTGSCIQGWRAGWWGGRWGVLCGEGRQMRGEGVSVEPEAVSLAHAARPAHRRRHGDGPRDSMLRMSRPAAQSESLRGLQTYGQGIQEARTESRGVAGGMVGRTLGHTLRGGLPGVQRGRGRRGRSAGTRPPLPRRAPAASRRRCRRGRGSYSESSIGSCATGPISSINAAGTARKLSDSFMWRTAELSIQPELC